MARTRLVAEHFKRDGLPKRRYSTPEAARRAVGRGRDHVYRCGFCGEWHRATPKGLR